MGIMSGYAYTLALESYQSAKESLKLPFEFESIVYTARYIESRNNMRMPHITGWILISIMIG
jgi:hypothetical protein